MREYGILLAKGGSPAIRQVPVSLAEQPGGPYDLTAVFVRTHQVDAVLESLAGLDGDALSLLNWAAGPEPLGAAIDLKRVPLGFPTAAGTMDGGVVRYRATTIMTRLIPMPIGEPDGRTTPRSERVVQMFRFASINAKFEPKMGAWLTLLKGPETALPQGLLWSLRTLSEEVVLKGIGDLRSPMLWITVTFRGPRTVHDLRTIHDETLTTLRTASDAIGITETIRGPRTIHDPKDQLFRPPMPIGSL